jgi:hypothetical protein
VRRRKPNHPLAFVPRIGTSVEPASTPAGFVTRLTGPG